MSAGGFPVDLVLFGMIAAFLVLRLRSILGRRDGFEPSQGRTHPAGLHQAPVIEGKAEVAELAGRIVPDQDSALGQTLLQMRRIDPAFEPTHFLLGAEAAFRLIVTEFAAGRPARLRSLLTEQTFAVFESVISARNAAGETQVSEIRNIQEVVIEGASLTGTTAEISVRFVSDQISQTLDREGRPVAGADAVTELRDVWSFVRDLSDRSDPVWRLAHVRSA